MADAYLYQYFISYSADGRAWVQGILLPKLRRAGKAYFLEEDFAVGAAWLDEMQQAVQQSQRVLVVLTPQYLLSKEKKFIEIMAMTKGAEQATWPLIPILLKPVGRDLLLRSLSIVDLTQARTQEQQLRKLLQEQGVASVSALKKPNAPYPGMSAFNEADAGRFFGREQEIRQYVDFLYENRCLVIIGASGCGKSSLVYAGIVPALQNSQLFGQDRWRIIKLRPNSPAFQCWNAVDMLSLQAPAQAAPARLLLIVDQFEELFSLEPDANNTTVNQQVQSFLQQLAQLFKQASVYLIITIRDDYFPQLADCQTWLPLDHYLKRLGALSRAGLVVAIRKPAEENLNVEARVWFDDVLIERLVNDAGNDPGILPFVQETLRKLWELMPERYISLAEYEALGNGEVSGLKYAIALKAETAFNQLASHAHKIIAQRIFLRLIQFGEGQPDTRRQQSLNQLIAVQDDPSIFQNTLAHLSSNQYRLLTLSGEQAQPSRVDIVHEALIKAWPRLQQWIKSYKANEQIRRDFLAKATRWQAAGKGLARLLDRTELDEIQTLLAKDQLHLFDLDENAQHYLSLSQQELNPGWNSAGLGLLASGIIAWFSALAYLFLIANHFADSSIKYGFWVFLCGLIGIGFYFAWHTERERFYKWQVFSHFLMRSRKYASSIILLIGTAVFLWANYGFAELERRNYCQQYSKTSNAQKNLGLINSIQGDIITPLNVVLSDDNYKTKLKIHGVTHSDDFGKCSEQFDYAISVKEAAIIGQTTKHYEVELVNVKTKQSLLQSVVNEANACTELVQLGDDFLKVLGLDVSHVRTFDSNVKTDISCNAEIKNEIGFRYFKRYQFALAVDAYQAALRDSPQFTEASLNLARAYFATENYAAAVPMLRQALSYDNKQFNLLFYLADSSFFRNEFRQAEPQYWQLEKYADNDNQKLQVYNRLLSISIKRNDEVGIKQVSAKIDQLGDITEPILQAEYFKNLGIIQFLENNCREADKSFQKSLTVNHVYKNEILYYQALCLKQTNPLLMQSKLNAYIQNESSKRYKDVNYMQASELLMKK